MISYAYRRYQHATRKHVCLLRLAKYFILLFGSIWFVSLLTETTWNYEFLVYLKNKYFTEVYKERVPVPEIVNHYFPFCKFSSASSVSYADLLMNRERQPLIQHEASSCATLKDSEFRLINADSENTQDLIYAYSAYLDQRLAKDRPMVRVLVQKLPLRFIPIYCHFFHKDSKQKLLLTRESTRLEGRGRGMHRLYEWQTPSLVSYMLTCPIPLDLVQYICSVVLSTQASLPVGDRSKISLELPLRSMEPVKNRRVSCVRNLQNTGNIPLNFLAEFIEFTRRMGSEIIVFYASEKLPPGLQALLRSFNRDFSDHEYDTYFEIRLVPWFLPDPDRVYSFSQPLLTNDCMMRVNSVAEYVQFHDIDEILVPSLLHPTLDQAIEQYFQDYPSRSVMCLFNVYFPYEQMPNNTVLRLSEAKSRCIYRDPVQSKCILKGRSMLEMNVHRAVLDLENRFTWFTMADPDRYARMHHIKEHPPFEYCGNTDRKIDLVKDSSHLRFIEPDWNMRIAERLRKVVKLCVHKLDDGT